MKLFLSFLMVALAAAAQSAPPAEGGAAPAAPQAPQLMFFPPDTVVATLDGEKIYASELQAVLSTISEQQRQMALADPRSLLEQIGLLRRLSALAEKNGLDQKSPLKEQLAYNRMLTLANAQLNQMANYSEVTPEEAKRFYEQNLDVYTQARVKLIYIPFSPNAPSGGAAGDKKSLSESEAKAKAEKIYAELQKGADFVKMVREHSGDPTSASKDGDFMPIRKSDQLPQEIKDAVFSLKPGQISKPVRQPNGYYILRLESLDVEPFEAVQGKLMIELRQSHVNEFIEKTRSSLQIKIERPEAFSSTSVSTPNR
jgi:peptidyl-prolyl cis-trans isomerase C